MGFPDLFGALLIRCKNCAASWKAASPGGLPGRFFLVSEVMVDPQSSPWLHLYIYNICIIIYIYIVLYIL